MPKKVYTREEMIANIKDYLDLMNTTSDAESTQDMAEYIVGGCFETFLGIDDGFWKGVKK